MNAIFDICIFHGNKSYYSVYIFWFCGSKYNGSHLTGILHNLHGCFVEPYS